MLICLHSILRASKFHRTYGWTARNLVTRYLQHCRPNHCHQGPPLVSAARRWSQLTELVDTRIPIRHASNVLMSDFYHHFSNNSAIMSEGVRTSDFTLEGHCLH